MKKTSKLLSVLIVMSMIISAFASITAFADSATLTLKSGSALSIGEYEGKKIIKGLAEKKTVADLLSNFESSESIAVTAGDTVTDAVLTDSDRVCTGTKVALGDDVAYVVIKGDTDGDGVVSSTDYIQVKSHFIGNLVLKGVNFVAADSTESGTLDTTDYIQVKSYFLGDFDLYPQPTVEPEEFTFTFTDVALSTTGSDIVLTINGTYTGEGTLAAKINDVVTEAVFTENTFSISCDVSSLVEAKRWYDIHVYYSETEYVDIDVTTISYDADTAVSVGDRVYKFAAWENMLKVQFESTAYDPFAGIDPTIAGILKSCEFKMDWVYDESGNHANGGWYPQISFKGTIPEEYRGYLNMVNTLQVRFSNTDKGVMHSENVTWDGTTFQIDYKFDLTDLLQYHRLISRYGNRSGDCSI